MKKLLLTCKRRVTVGVLFILAIPVVLSVSCNKIDHIITAGDDPSKFSSEVIDKWLTMQIRLMRDATGIANVQFSRYYAYTGVAAFEALSPGSDLKKFTNGKWNGLTNLPFAEPGKRYYWPASVNASLASINRNLFQNASPSDKAAIDSLEQALNASFSSLSNDNVLENSSNFGKAVGAAVFAWSETDGIKHVSDPYTPPTGIGLCVPTPPAFAPASTPYFGKLRPIIAGSTDNSQPAPPIPYSTDPKSPFYQMVLEVYNAHQNITAEQTAWALFWRDVPGVTSGGHWESILQQVLKITHSNLEKAAFAYAVTGVCNSDPCISCWQTKYYYNVVRPITYIQNVMGFTSWSSTLTTPAHPEYSSAHAVLSAATSEAFAIIFGDIGPFTDHTYDYLGFAPRFSRNR